MTNIIAIEPDGLNDLRTEVKKLTAINEMLVTMLTGFINGASENMTHSQTAKYIGRSESALYGLVNRRMIPFQRVGKKLSYNKSEIDLWINSGKVLTKAELVDDAKMRLN